jgi:glycosyltransferase involved in cell wall biosynthesis
MFDRIIATGPVPDNIGGKVSTQIVTINPGVDQELFQPITNGGQKDTNILYVGRFGPVKRVNDLVSAFSEVQAKHEHTTLTLVGDGPLRGKIEKQINELGISDHVKMSGYVPQHELPKYYNHADVFVLPSQIERAPLVLLEAMSCGLPVVSTPVGWVPEIITDEKNGILFEIGSETELADKIRYLIDNPEHCNKIGERARRTVKEGYTWEDRGEQTLDLLNSIVNENG